LLLLLLLYHHEVLCTAVFLASWSAYHSTVGCCMSTCFPTCPVFSPRLAGAVYVRRHTEHSSNIVLRHNPHRSELPQLPAVVDAKKAPAQRKDGQAAGAGGKALGAGAASSKLGAELLVRLDGFLQQFLDGAYDLLMTQVSSSASSCQSTLLEF
jgi:hypothetical protein